MLAACWVDAMLHCWCEWWWWCEGGSRLVITHRTVFVCLLNFQSHCTCEERACLLLHSLFQASCQSLLQQCTWKYRDYILLHAGILSRGDASIFMRFPPPSYREKIWDHCAGFCIVEEAGGKVTDGAGRRLDFSKGRYLELDKGILAAPAQMHDALVQAIHKLAN